jgi:hypothetical protein
MSGSASFHSASKSFPRNHPAKRLAGHALHRDEVDTGVGGDVMDRDDIWVIQRARGFGFLNKTRFAAGVG